MSKITETNFEQDYQAALKEYLARVTATFGDRVLSATLFGSKARRDDTPDSDIDVLLIVNTDWPDSASPQEPFPARLVAKPTTLTSSLREESPSPQ